MSNLSMYSDYNSKTDNKEFITKHILHHTVSVVLTPSAIDRGTIQLVCVASPLSTQHKGIRSKTG